MDIFLKNPNAFTGSETFFLCSDTLPVGSRTQNYFIGDEWTSIGFKSQLTRVWYATFKREFQQVRSARFSCEGRGEDAECEHWPTATRLPSLQAVSVCSRKSRKTVRSSPNELRGSAYRCFQVLDFSRKCPKC